MAAFVVAEFFSDADGVVHGVDHGVSGAYCFAVGFSSVFKGAEADDAC